MERCDFNKLLVSEENREWNSIFKQDSYRPLSNITLNHSTSTWNLFYFVSKEVLTGIDAIPGVAIFRVWNTVFLAEAAVVPRRPITLRSRLFVKVVGVGSLERIEVQQHPAGLGFHQKLRIGVQVADEAVLQAAVAPLGSGLVDGRMGNGWGVQQQNYEQNRH